MNLSDPVLDTFRHFELSSPMQRALEAAGYQTPTPIQLETIAPVLAGRDLIATAQTGTGKTAAFLIPLVERLRQGGGAALILAPTRELAEQTQQWARRLGCGLPSALVVGGVGYGPQIDALRRRPAIIVATPGRLVDHLDRQTLHLQQVRALVLDEADRMLDMGFKPQLDRILRALPTERQTLLFSATLPAELAALTRRHVRNPVTVAIGPPATLPSRASQDVYLVHRDHKTPLLLSLIERDAGTVLVFARTKHRTDRLARALCNAGHAAQRLHADRSQSQRREALAGFRGGRYRVLIATDIAARGLDVHGIRRVINYDLPQTVEDYVHRVGRTARAGADGHATSFAAPEEHGQLRAIERHVGGALLRRTHDLRLPAAAPSRAKETPHEQRARHASFRPRALGYAARDRRARQG